jgi:hypothetical protein
VDYAHCHGSQSRQDLARRFCYGNGDYIGKCGKALTGIAFRELVARGTDMVFDCMSRRFTRSSLFPQCQKDGPLSCPNGRYRIGVCNQD